MKLVAAEASPGVILDFAAPAPDARTPRPSLAVIIPALNEEDNIVPTLRAVLRALEGRFQDYEVLVLNDGSTDETGARARAFAERHPRVRVINNRVRMGIGFSFMRGLRLARMEKCVMIPGDNETDHDSIVSIFERVGEADAVLTYPGNPEVRPAHRRLISRIFTTLLNLAFNLRVKYYNGTNVYPRSLLLSFPPNTHGPAYSASIVVRMLRTGVSFVEAPMHIMARPAGSSNIFRWRNILNVAQAFFRLYREQGPLLR